MAALNMHIARVAFLPINKITGKVVDKGNPATTFGDTLQTEHQHVVLPDTNIPATVNPSSYPTIDVYLTREAAAGYKIQYMDQNRVITYA